MRRAVSGILGAAVVFALLGGGALWIHRRIPTALPSAPNYDQADAWLCRAGRADPCAAPTTATRLAPGGETSVVTDTPDPSAPIDCFYVYPTVSRAHAAYSPVAATREETAIVRRQLAPFTSVCRPFAPLYRQVTLAGLPQLFGGDPRVTLAAPYADVLAAWRSYLAHDNQGRGIVLIGHSQGARLLARLMAAEIDGQPIAAKLVMAILPGADIDVPQGKTIGGTFKHIPLCTRAGETGCVIAYSSYPAGRAMPADARFGTSATAGMSDACVDPASLDGAAHLDADLPLTPDLAAKFGTDVLELPGLLSARCTTGRFSVLDIAVAPDDRAGEPTAGLIERLAQYQPAYGLHALDLNLAAGTLVDLVRKATASYSRR